MQEKVPCSSKVINRSLPVRPTLNELVWAGLHKAKTRHRNDWNTSDRPVYSGGRGSGTAAPAGMEIATRTQAIRTRLRIRGIHIIKALHPRYDRP